MVLEIDWLIVTPIIVVIIGSVLPLIIKRYELINLRSKHYHDRLESSIRYFKEFYDSKEYNQIVLDRAAQDLSQCKRVNANLVNRLIEYHQNHLINFDELINNFDFGGEFIIFKKGDTLNIHEDLKIKPSKIHIKIKKTIYFISYITLTLGAVELLFLAFSVGSTLLSSFIYCMYSIVLFIFAFIFMVQRNKLIDSEKFIKKIYEAEEKYQTLPRKISIILPKEHRSTINPPK